LTSNGRLFSVGSNNRGQLGVGDKVDRGQPTEINLSFLNENENITSLSLGIQHSMILTNQNRVFIWGYGSFRNLGQGSSNADLVVPTIVNFSGLLENESISKIYGFNFTSIVITSLNRVYMWGYENDGLGDMPTTSTWGTPRVVTIANLQENEYIESFQQAGYGVYNFVARTNLNRYMVWGRNGNNELNDGLNPTTRRHADALNLDFIQPNETVTSVVAGSSAMFVLTDLGTLYSWGSGFNNQLGHGDALQKLTPTAVDLTHLTFLEGEKIVNVSTSNTWNFAFTNEGRLLAWGRFYTSRPQFI
jgi:alpha-tubulin suppressor-like RCC1 family protein